MLRYTAILVGLVPLALCWPGGADPRSCGALIPGHGADPQVGDSPFTITGPSRVKVGSDVDLTLHGNANTLRGFIIRAYEDTVASTGQFQNGTDVKPLTCDGGDDSASHNSRTDKPRVNLIWTAPNYPTIVTFNSTVVANFTNIYLSEPIYIEVV